VRENRYKQIEKPTKVKKERKKERKEERTKMKGKWVREKRVKEIHYHLWPEIWYTYVTPTKKTSFRVKWRKHRA
jgi:hypothetical protein